MYLITGVSGVGKTSTAKELANRLPKSVYIGADDIQHFIVNGLLWPDEEPKKEADEQLVLRDENLIALSNNFCKRGFVPIIDVIIAYNHELKRYIEGLNVKPKLVILDASDKVIIKRDRLRKKHVAKRWGHLRPEIRRLKDKGLYIDNSEKSIDEVVDIILNIYNG